MACPSRMHVTLPSCTTSSSSSSSLFGGPLRLAPIKRWISLRKAPFARAVVTATNIVHKRIEEKGIYSIAPEKAEILNQLENWADIEILPFLKPVEKCWQPQDFLPESSSEDFIDEVRELRAMSSELPDDYLVCLVGDTITEEALPTYQTMFNSFVSTRDEMFSPWARWIRSWTAEENRHGDLLNKYLYLTGKVDMRILEKTIHYLITSGMDVGLENSPYFGFIYTSFQERATFISHGNTARQAKKYGDTKLAKICGTIAADEKRHEHAYSKVVEKLFEIDPNGTMLAFEHMMRKKIVMPAHLMYDGHDERLFEHFSCVAQRLGVYTAKDYADILEHFVRRWKVEKLSQLSSDGQAAQEYVCGLSARIRKLEERAQSRVNKRGPIKAANFGWVFNREVALL